MNKNNPSPKPTPISQDQGISWFKDECIDAYKAGLEEGKSQAQQQASQEATARVTEEIFKVYNNEQFMICRRNQQQGKGYLMYEKDWIELHDRFVGYLKQELNPSVQEEKK